MGEEAAGADAVRIACARIAARQGEMFLVGGSYHAERPDVLLLYELGGKLWKQDFRGVWSRQAQGGGVVPGSVGCFLVIESRAHVVQRGARALAHIAAIATDRCRRDPGEATRNATAQFATMRGHIEQGASAVISGASGVHAATEEEAAFLRCLGLPVRGIATALGHSLEPSFPASLAVAAMAIKHSRLFPPLEDSPMEAPMDGELRRVLATSWGHWRGEAMAVVEAA